MNYSFVMMALLFLFSQNLLARAFSVDRIGVKVYEGSSIRYEKWAFNCPRLKPQFPNQGCKLDRVIWATPTQNTLIEEHHVEDGDLIFESNIVNKREFPFKVKIAGDTLSCKFKINKKDKAEILNCHNNTKTVKYVLLKAKIPSTENIPKKETLIYKTGRHEEETNAAPGFGEAL